MMAAQLQDWVLIGGASLLAALIAVCVLMPGLARRNRGPGPLGDTAVWLFDGNDLLDLSDRARILFDGDAQRPDWASLCNWLRRQFPGVPSEQTLIRNAMRISVPSVGPDDDTELICEWLNGIIRVELSEGGAAPGGNGLLLAQRQELATLRGAVEHSPFPIWQVTEEGQVRWTNPAYARLDRQKGPDQSRPLFPLLVAAGSGKRRLPVVTPEDGAKRWFDVSVVTEGAGALCYAIDADAMVEAEDAQRQFVQTLAKTFAQLSIGLAIFDRNRQLALFNPALVDLTGLSPEFLTLRPNMLSFFDHLRDRKMMPEPKNYSSWRHRMADLVAAASDGRYHETWSLPSGSVYSVSGRPHPDGAIAFLFEDITAEITLTRRFRSDLEMGQCILDRLDHAIAVFAADGSLTVTNAAYRELWSVDPDNSFAQISVIEATRTWQKQCKASPLWGEIRDFVGLRENRTDWWADVQLTSGEPVSCRIIPLQKGATMVSFQRLARASTPLRNDRATAAGAHG
ncbi:PAS-domain containing protein [Seohaeicola zhoushanensis]|nr:PAS-domain containing protein [Seohaeicola zhoushanensis]